MSTARTLLMRVFLWGRTGLVILCTAEARDLLPLRIRCTSRVLASALWSMHGVQDVGRSSLGSSSGGCSACGLRASEFCRGEDYSPSTLQWWSSKLKRDARPKAAVPIAPVIRTRSTEAGTRDLRSAIVVEAVRTGARVFVDAKSSRAALSLVLELLGIGGRS